MAEIEIIDKMCCIIQNEATMNECVNSYTGQTPNTKLPTLEMNQLITKLCYHTHMRIFTSTFYTRV